jgi:hypothetical protein
MRKESSGFMNSKEDKAELNKFLWSGITFASLWEVGVFGIVSIVIICARMTNNPIVALMCMFLLPLLSGALAGLVVYSISNTHQISKRYGIDWIKSVN